MLHDGKKIGITRAPDECSPQDDRRPGPGGPPNLHRWLDPLGHQKWRSRPGGYERKRLPTPAEWTNGTLEQLLPSGKICNAASICLARRRTFLFDRPRVVWLQVACRGAEKSMHHRCGDQNHSIIGRRPAAKRHVGSCLLVLVTRSESAECRLCGEDEESAEHLWLQCRALDAAR